MVNKDEYIRWGEILHGKGKFGSCFGSRCYGVRSKGIIRRLCIFGLYRRYINCIIIIIIIIIIIQPSISARYAMRLFFKILRFDRLFF